MIAAETLLHTIGQLFYVGCAAVCVIAGLWLGQRPVAWRRERVAALCALALTGLWAGVLAALGVGSLWAAFVEGLRNLAWLALLHALFAGGADRQTARCVRLVFASLVLVECLRTGIVGADALFGAGPAFTEATTRASALLHMLVAIGALVLLHNLFIAASHTDRAGTRLAALSLCALWVFELNFYAVSWFTGEFPAQIAAVRGLVVGIALVPLAMAFGADVRRLRLRASRKVAFRSLSLLLIVGYLIAMAGLARLLTLLEADGARLAQVGFLVALVTVMALWLPSAQMRARARVTLQKHLFSHRYDYRAEWLRLADTIGRWAEEGDTLHLRIPKAMADITESPGAALYLTDADGSLTLAETWCWPTLDDDASAMPRPLSACLATQDYIVDLEEWRAGGSIAGAVGDVPPWLDAGSPAWAIVPLRHFDRLQGAVLLARPLVDRQLDWEDFDLLKVVGRQLASYLAEQASQRALMEAARFDEFNRRMAFVLHDIKNLASQLSLLSHNAQRHADNPQFRADMLTTLRTSTERLDTLIRRLGRYGRPREAQIGPFDLAQLAREVAQACRQRHRVDVTCDRECRVRADREGLEQALVHLLQNAIDASPATAPVCVAVHDDGAIARIEIVDSGEGMDPAFVRDRLFAPFVSSKPDGFGIGALEARELVRAMAGSLKVQSRPGAGTRFTIELPRAAEGDAVRSAHHTSEAT